MTCLLQNGGRYRDEEKIPWKGKCKTTDLKSAFNFKCIEKSASVSWKDWTISKNVVEIELLVPIHVRNILKHLWERFVLCTLSWENVPGWLVCLTFVCIHASFHGQTQRNSMYVLGPMLLNISFLTVWPELQIDHSIPLMNSVMTNIILVVPHFQLTSFLILQKVWGCISDGHTTNAIYGSEQQQEPLLYLILLIMVIISTKMVFSILKLWLDPRYFLTFELHVSV